jgi:type IX secretion system PorP/SprF family membrane protein
MRKHIFLVITIFSVGTIFSQQDPQYNLYQFNQLIINPAYAGARDNITVVAAIRNQWAGFEGSPKTSCISVHAPVLNRKLGIGLSMVNDVIGPRQLFAVGGNLAYWLKLSSKWKLSFGVNAGYNRIQFNFDKLKFKNNETTNIFDNRSYNALDINSGFYLKSNTFFIGLSATHIGAKDLYSYYTPRSTSGILAYRLRTHIFLTMGKSFVINENFIFAPTIMTKRQNGIATGDLNFNFFIYKKLWLGLFLRDGYGPGFLTQYYISNNFKVGYSFDTGVGGARQLGPSHEVIIGFDFSTVKSKMLSPRFL